ncbi:hypothetical protein B0O99DRAFT_626863 [Bisporella sp. PMI_857]|nr:hypothetical protein B0O99DRAFT_626863 [Bisporella sp. PMI_857]
MPTLRDFLKKKDKLNDGGEKLPKHEPPPPADPNEFQFTFMRSDTHTQEIISPPTFASIESTNPPSVDGGKESRMSSLFKGRPRTASTASKSSAKSNNSEKSKSPPGHKRLSHRLGLRREHSSSNVPDDLPDIQVVGDNEDTTGVESQWEARATRLAKKNEQQRSRPNTPGASMSDLGSFKDMSIKPDVKRSVSSQQADDNIQEAIRLHEAGELETATQMFGRLADPNGENNALSQVLYGLALRHGWGITPDPEAAVKYLSAAASNASDVEELALKAGMKKGGAAKGELVLAIFELGNCFRHGWGVPVDKIAAKQYYETAANLGDTDAMNEVAWCYDNGFGCKKDRFAAAKYYRLAESKGSKTLGNTWIWKDKYNEGNQKK